MMAFVKDPEASGARKIYDLISQMDNQQIQLKGYFIPLNGKSAQSHFMFSAYPYANCFFCGNAGPESVIEVFTKDELLIKYSDAPITLEGTFKFSSRDPSDVMFELREAQLVE